MLGGISNYAVGLGYGLGGRAMSMLSRGGQAGYNLGQLSRFAASSAWATNTGRGAMIGAGAGGAWGMVSDDTSVLGGAAMGALGGAGIGRYGGAALGSRGAGWNAAAGAFADAAARGGNWAGLGAARPYAGGIASNMGAGVMNQLRADFGGLMGAGGRAGNWVASNTRSAAAAVSARASAAPAGASLAANAPVSRVSSSMSGSWVVGGMKPAAGPMAGPLPIPAAINYGRFGGARTTAHAGRAAAARRSQQAWAAPTVGPVRRTPRPVF